MEAPSQPSDALSSALDPSIADLNIFAPRSGGALRGRLWAKEPSLLSLEEAAALVAEAPRVIAWVSAIQAGAIERVREGIAEAPLDSRDGQPERLSGEVAHALAVTEIATLQETSEATAARLMNLAHELSTTHVAVMEAIESGDITEAHARAIVDQAASLPEEVREAYGIAVLKACRTRTGRLRTPAEFRRAARDLREKMHPESIQTRRRAAAQERGVWQRPEEDGMVTLTALMPAETGMALYRRVDSLARAQHRTPDEHRTLSQLRADALTHLGLNGVLQAPDATAAGSRTQEDPRAAAHPRMDTGLEEPTHADVIVAQGAIAASAGGDDIVGGTADVSTASHAGDIAQMGNFAVPEEFAGSLKAEIVVHLPAAVLLGSATGNGYLDGYGIIDADTARQLAAAAPNWHRLYTDTDGTPLRLGRTAYRPPEAMRRFLRYRDGTCAFPGCNQPAESSELDHTHEWQDGGGTDADNLAHLCRKHHALKSLALVQARQTAAARAPEGQYAEPTGTVVWTTMLSYAQTTTPSDRDRLLGYIDDSPPRAQYPSAGSSSFTSAEPEAPGAQRATDLERETPSTALRGLVDLGQDPRDDLGQDPRDDLGQDARAHLGQDPRAEPGPPPPF
ncbi:DUF222 domain-containing protein [Sinomonas sp. ASV486]|uniref:HNH endonuclease n=1 Tax=Sinomonas sp. ASV486 TaxID=3051170 RepID=UPI0027DC80DB|nr:DUF222 domain-containing protein [Sinomonas sp. ASV486]MDQ4490914.1 DUF222 domain-containing protein [Sinomonas sp. ASV486]